MAPQTKIGARPTGADANGADGASGKGGAAGKGGKKKKLIVMGGAAILVIALVAFWFLAGPGKAAGAAADPGATPTPTPTASPEPKYDLGAVVKIDSISINLQGGHYLRLGIGLQLIKGVKEAPDTAKALDAAIALYSGHTTEELADLNYREELKTQLGETLFELYEGDVVGVYYTDFVTQ